VSGHGFQPCRKAQQETLPYAARLARNAAERK